MATAPPPEHAASPPSTVAPASLGRRSAAGVLDLAVTFIAFLLVSAATGGIESGDGSAHASVEGASAAVFFALLFLYYFVPETLAGTSVGKRVLGLRVVRADGTRAGAGPIALRTLLRAIDVLPGVYALGFVVAALTPHTQRIGDLAARTLVVQAAAA